MLVTDRVAQCILRLPLFASMTDMQVNQVCSAVRSFYLQPGVSAVS
jgi:dTDP-4-amino-4,6-dideoxygalactose transaminase